jgi:hypothetical protein
MYKRLSNNETVDLSEPLYIQWNGLNGYLVESNGEIYHFFTVDAALEKECVTEYFEKL